MISSDEIPVDSKRRIGKYVVIGFLEKKVTRIRKRIGLINNQNTTKIVSANYTSQQLTIYNYRQSKSCTYSKWEKCSIPSYSTVRKDEFSI